MKVVKSYTDREIRIILEAIVEDTVRSHGLEKILKESDERNQVEITERGRETIKATLYAIASIITIDLPIIGWILGPLLTFFTFTGSAPDAVINLLEGKMGVDKFIEAAENAAIKIVKTSNIPIVGSLLPDIDRLTSMVEPASERNATGLSAADKLKKLLMSKGSVKDNKAKIADIKNYIEQIKIRSGNTLTGSQAASIIYAVDLLLDVLTAAYLTRGKTVKKTKGRKKKNFKIPGGKEGFVSFGLLPIPYNHLKGIDSSDPVESNAYDSIIEDDPDVEIVDDDFDDDGIIDVDAEEILSGDEGDTVRVSGVDYRKRTPELPYTDGEDDGGIPVDQQIRKQLGLSVDQDGYLFKPKPGDDFELEDDDLEETRYVKNLREQIEVIKIINKVLR